MAKIGERVARRYARALAEQYQLADLEAVRDSLNTLATVWQESSSLRSAMRNPAFSVAQRSSVLRDLAGKARSSKEHGADEKFGNFIVLLLQNGRFEGLSDVALAFAQYIDELRKRLTLSVSSAHIVADAERKELSAHIEKEFGGLASIEWRQEPSLIGGLVVRAGDRVLDSSIRGALENLHNQLSH